MTVSKDSFVVGWSGAGPSGPCRTSICIGARVVLASTLTRLSAAGVPGAVGALISAAITRLRLYRLQIQNQSRTWKYHIPLVTHEPPSGGWVRQSRLLAEYRNASANAPGRRVPAHPARKARPQRHSPRQSLRRPVPPDRAAPQLRRVGAADASGVLAAGLRPSAAAIGPKVEFSFDGPGVGAGASRVGRQSCPGGGGVASERGVTIQTAAHILRLGSPGPGAGRRAAAAPFPRLRSAIRPRGVTDSRRQ